jgi:hypothetical protein
MQISAWERNTFSDAVLVMSGFIIYLEVMSSAAK